jgi:hypothetical protein
VQMNSRPLCHFGGPPSASRHCFARFGRASKRMNASTGAAFLGREYSGVRLYRARPQGAGVGAVRSEMRTTKLGMQQAGKCGGFSENKVFTKMFVCLVDLVMCQNATLSSSVCAGG